MKNRKKPPAGPVLLFDIGATNLRLALTSSKTALGEVIELPTPRRFDDLIQIFRTLRGTLAPGRRIGRIVGGIAGQMDSTGNKLIVTTNISPDWLNRPFGATLNKIFNAPVNIQNDVALGALGEAAYGAGRGERIVAFLMLGTGYGGCRIVDQRIDDSTRGFEPGKQRMIINGHKAVTIGSQVSGRGVTERFKKLPREIHDVRIWRGISETFGYSVVNAILMWSPDVVVLGGSMFKNPGILLPTVQQVVDKNLSEFPTRPRIVLGELGDKFGLYGALALARSARK